MMTPGTVPADALAALAELVEARTGLRFVGGRYGELATKLERAFVESECATWQEYQSLVSSGALFEQLVETLTIGETYFYRHRPYFDMLEREILPEIVAKRRDAKRLRVWCAGCATGEEAYSLAIAVRGMLPDIHAWQATVLATDLNRGYLARAEAGVYGEWSFRDTDPAFKTSNFVADGKRFRVRPELREMVRFSQLNLAEDGYPSAAGGTTGLDLILCRNVLLYFAPDLSQRVVGRLRSALVPGGWLVLGPSDPRPGLLAEFEMRAGDGAVVYQRVDRDVALPVVTIRQEWVPALTLQPPIVVRKEPVIETDDWHSAWVLARASADGGQLDLAEEHCQQAIKRGRLRPEPYYLFGALRLARGDDAGSLEAHRKALYVDPRFVPALLAQAAIHRRGGDSVRARQALVRAQRLLDGRLADEWVLVDDGLTVGRLRDAVAQALSAERAGPC